MRVPSRLATSQMVSPSAAVTGFPSSVKVILLVISKIVPEMSEKVVDRIGRSLSQPADGRIAHHQFEVTDGSLVGAAFLLQQCDHLFGAFAAWRALAAAFVLEELQEVDRDVLDIVGLREDD